MAIKQYDIVILKKRIAENIPVGSEGTIVEILENEKGEAGYIVEFVREGKTIGVVSLTDKEFVPTLSCKVCGRRTETIFNINFKAVSVCESCARAIFIQQATWYANEK